jgi:hypothetical protein
MLDNQYIPLASMFAPSPLGLHLRTFVNSALIQETHFLLGDAFSSQSYAYAFQKWEHQRCKQG